MEYIGTHFFTSEELEANKADKFYTLNVIVAEWRALFPTEKRHKTELTFFPYEDGGQRVDSITTYV